MCIPAALCIAQWAAAGHYEVTYSGGGPAQIVGPSGIPWTSPYQTNLGGRGGGGASSDPPNDQGLAAVGPGSVSCSGQITATFTWTPDYQGDLQPPPPAAIIRKTASASWSGDSGSCSDGLGDFPTGDLYSGSSSGTHYSVRKSPGASFTESCTPTASASKSWGGPSPTIAAGAYVNYYAAAYPVRIRLEGVLDPVTNKRILIGQRLNASLDLGGLQTSGDNVFKWNVGPGKPFQNYQPSTPSVYVPWTPVSITTTETSSSIYTHFADPRDATSTISCSVITANPPLSIDVDETVSLDQPAYYSQAPSVGTMQLLLGTTPNTTSPDKFRLWGATFPGVQTWGIYYAFWVTTPTAYSAGTDLGSFCGANLCNSTSSYTDSSGQTTNDSPFGVLCLDHSYPYPSTPSTGAGPHVGSNGKTKWLLFSDRPGFDIGAGVTGQFHQAMTFEFYAMYNPSWNGFGALQVPVRRLKWKALGDATSGSPWTQIDNGSSSDGEDDFPPHPMWTQVIH